MAKKTFRIKDKQGNAVDYGIPASRVVLDSDTDLDEKIGDIEDDIEEVNDSAVKQVTFNGGTPETPDEHGNVSLNQEKADWSESNSDSPKFIKNKPDIVEDVFYEEQTRTFKKNKNGTVSEIMTLPEQGSSGYEPPQGGIPKTDLATAVQESLNLADSSLQPSDKTQLQGAITQLQNALNTLIGSGNVQGVIDTFNEVVAFLNGIDTDDPTLFNQLKSLSDAITALQTALAGKISGIRANGSSSNLPVDQNGVVELPPAASPISPATNAPIMDGTAGVGISDKYAREDHVHPHDTTKQDSLTFDDAPTAGSNNPVKSGGIKTALDAKADSATTYNKTEVDDAIDDKLTSVVVNAIPAGSIAIIDDLTTGGSTNALSAEQGKDLNERFTEVCGGITYEEQETIVTRTSDVNMTTGKFIRTGLDVGAVCSMNEEEYTGIDCAVINLNAGDILEAKGVAGTSSPNIARLWALLDKTTHEVLSVDPGHSVNPLPQNPYTATIVAEVDCIAVVNAYNSTYPSDPYANKSHTPYSFKVTTHTTETVLVPVPVGGIIGGMQDDIEELQSQVEGINSFNGKKLAALGDSIVWGYTPRNYDGHTAGEQLDSFAKLAAERLGMTFANYGISGSTVSVVSGQNRSPMCNRYGDLPNDADVVIFMGGINDATLSAAVLGTMSDRSTGTFYGALHVTMQGLYTKYIGGVAKATGKQKKIIICTPIKSLDASKMTSTNTIANNAVALLQWDAWITAIKEVAKFYSFPVLDLYDLSGINPHLDRTLQGTTSGGATAYFNPYVTDGIHPTQEGHEMMADLLVGFIKSLK